MKGSSVDLFAVVSVDLQPGDTAETVRERIAMALDNVAERVLRPGWDGGELEFVEHADSGEEYVAAVADVNLVDADHVLTTEFVGGGPVGEA